MSRRPSHPPLRVLLVEDDADSSEALVMLLERGGYQTVCTDNARDALAVLGSAARPDVMLLDLTLRDVRGGELLEAFLAAGPLPPTVVISASPERTLRDAAERLCARGALRKPFGTEAFLLAIAEAASATVQPR